MRLLAVGLGFGVVAAAVVGCDVDKSGPGEADDPTVDRFGMACDVALQRRECGNDALDELRQGEQYCFQSEGELMWGECVVYAACDVLESEPCADGGPSCVLDGDGVPERAVCTDPTPQGEEPGCDFECDTPLVLALGDAPVAFRTAAGAAFDIAGAGRCDSHDWPTAESPWLAIDLDGNGRIDAGNELFGSGTVLGSGMKADNGFTALAELDSDADGVISELDERWSELVAWSDFDGDKRTDAGELEPLSAFGIATLPLAYERRPECDGQGNCAIEQAAMERVVDGVARASRLVDVHLPCRGPHQSVAQ